MTGARISPWRVLLVVGGALAIAGNMLHPSGTMVDMLVDPMWIPGHALVALGFVALAAGLVLYRQTVSPPGRTRWWAGVAVVMLALSALEMSIHTLAFVDAGNAPVIPSDAGLATPVLTTHLWLATVVYPLAGLALVGLMWSGMRERALGSPWIAWIGISGAIAHAAVMPLLLLGMMEFVVLFPLAILFHLWFCLAGLWPVDAPGGPRAAVEAGPAAREVVHPGP